MCRFCICPCSLPFCLGTCRPQNLSRFKHQKTPEEEELESKRLEYTQLEDQLVQKEFELETQRAELTAFNHLYQHKFGQSLAALDILRADIARVIATHRPNDLEAQKNAQETSEQSRESSQQDHQTPITKNEPPDFLPSESLKSLFRALVKKFHPDLTNSEAEKQRRHVLMIEIIRLYKAGDEEGLQRLLAQEASSPDAIQGDDVMSNLVRLIRQIATIRKRLQAIDIELAELENAEVYQLYIPVKQASLRGEDLMQVMVNEVETRIQRALNGLSSILEELN